MEVKILNEMINDKHFFELNKIKHKYGPDNLEGLIGILDAIAYEPIGLKNFKGENCVYIPSHCKMSSALVKKLMMPAVAGTIGQPYGRKAMEEEIDTSLKIEKIDVKANKETVYDMNKALDFISKPENIINEDNLYKLYQLAISKQLDETNRLPQGEKYRNDAVYVVGKEVYHQGLPHGLLDEYMSDLLAFINTEGDLPDLLKASIIHFYLAYLHPYFDGNGRMARLLHLWYLVQQGYPSALFYSISKHIEKTVKQYYESFINISENAKITGFTDLTPFINYFNNYVYKEMEKSQAEDSGDTTFEKTLADGLVTQKEKALWDFVAAEYGRKEFSTKMLEKDFGYVAYATVRSFVLKFEDLGLLGSRKYSNRNRYFVKFK